MGCPIRTSMDQSLFPAPHGLTQGITSFIASCCLGIHQTPLLRLIRHGKSKAAPPFAKAQATFRSKACTFPCDIISIPRSVVLDLEQSRACDAPKDSARSTPHLGQSARNRCVSLSTMSSDATAIEAAHHASDWTAGPAPTTRVTHGTDGQIGGMNWNGFATATAGGGSRRT